LVESKNAAEDFSKRLAKKDKKKYKEEIKLTKEVTKQIDSLVALYLGKEDKRQGITRNPEVTVMQRIGQANWYSGSRPAGLTKTERILLKQAEDELTAALDKTNSFFVTEWPEYKSKVEKIELAPFKETQPIKLE